MKKSVCLPEQYSNYKQSLTQYQIEIYKKCISMLEENHEFMNYAMKYNKSDNDQYLDDMYKTVNYKMCCLREARRIDALNIFSSKNKEVIFDIGCGTGYFSYFAKKAGHTVYSLDAPIDTCGKVIFIEGQKTLNLNMIYHTIKPFTPFPDLPQPCTLAVSFSPHFYSPSTEDFWRKAPWLFFLKDLAKQMPSGGKMYFHLNQVASRPEFGPFGTAETRSLFMSLGTVESDYIVTIDTRAVQKLCE